MSGESISITSKTPFTVVYIDGYVYVYLGLIWEVTHWTMFAHVFHNLHALASNSTQANKHRRLDGAIMLIHSKTYLWSITIRMSRALPVSNKKRRCKTKTQLEGWQNHAQILNDSNRLHDYWQFWMGDDWMWKKNQKLKCKTTCLFILLLSLSNKK